MLLFFANAGLLAYMLNAPDRIVFLETDNPRYVILSYRIMSEKTYSTTVYK